MSTYDPRGGFETLPDTEASRDPIATTAPHGTHQPSASDRDTALRSRQRPKINWSRFLSGVPTALSWCFTPFIMHDSHDEARTILLPFAVSACNTALNAALSTGTPVEDRWYQMAFVAAPAVTAAFAAGVGLATTSISSAPFVFGTALGTAAVTMAAGSELNHREWRRAGVEAYNRARIRSLRREAEVNQDGDQGQESLSRPPPTHNALRNTFQEGSLL